MQFHGLSPIPQNDFGVEFFVDDRLYDLHNCGYFLSFNLEIPSTAKLDFAHYPSVCGNEERPRRLQFVFSDVQRLNVSPPDPEMPRSEAYTLDHFNWFELDDGQGQFEWRFWDGLIIGFEASSITLHEGEVLKGDPPAP
jgi:hypothetical protein